MECPKEFGTQQGEEADGDEGFWTVEIDLLLKTGGPIKAHSAEEEVA